MRQQEESQNVSGTTWEGIENLQCVDINNNHELISVDNFEVIDANDTWKIKRKVAAALLIKEHSPDLNEQGQSIPLKLLN